VTIHFRRRLDIQAFDRNYAPMHFFSHKPPAFDQSALFDGNYVHHETAKFQFYDVSLFHARAGDINKKNEVF
jgi:hypothetical protein